MPQSHAGRTIAVFTTIAQHVDAVAERNQTFLRDLLKIPKPRMQEHQAVHFTADALRAAGCEVEIFPGEGSGEPTPAGPPLNILARRPGRGTGGGKSLLLEAHIDTVPPGMRERWTKDPWGGEIVDGRIYARGAHDDLAGVALACLVAQALHDLNISTAAAVHFLVTSEEEFSSGGMRALIKRHPDFKPDAHLLVDGNDDRDGCIVGHPGSLCFTVAIPGPSGSAQEPAYLHDANPIEFASRLMTSLRRLEDLPADPGWPRPMVAVVGIKSTGWISNVPERCELQIWANVMPPTTLEAYRGKVESIVREQAQTNAWFANNLPQIEWGPIDCPAMVTSTDSPFYRALADAHARSFNSSLTPRRIGGWGDMRLLNCPHMLFYGPGRGGNCHGYDEFYQLADLTPMLRSLLYLTIDWCGLAEA
jgi:acetylornithine deacetylase